MFGFSFDSRRLLCGDVAQQPGQLFGSDLRGLASGSGLALCALGAGEETSQEAALQSYPSNPSGQNETTRICTAGVGAFHLPGQQFGITPFLTHSHLISSKSQVRVTGRLREKFDIGPFLDGSKKESNRKPPGGVPNFEKHP